MRHCINENLNNNSGQKLPLCSRCLPFPNMRALFSPFPYSASQVCRKPQTLDWSYPVAVPGTPRVVFKPLPTACKERQREKLIDISIPAATWRMRKSRKINVIHNLYNLTLARKPLGSTPSLDESELPAPGVKTGWKAMPSTSLLAQTRTGLPPCKGYLIPKRRKERRENDHYLHLFGKGSHYS